MPKGIVDTVEVHQVRGDLLALFKPLDETLSNYNSKINIPLNLLNRASRKASYALLEVLVESRKPYSEWKLKLNGIGITRLFKPTYTLTDVEKDRGLYKFVYDITSILNIPESLNREWINLAIKYEGGDPFTIKAILLDVIYEDQDALTDYKHLTGLLMLKQGESVRFKLDPSGKALSARIITYAPKPTEIKVATNSYSTRHQVPQRRFEELAVTLGEKEEFIEVSPIGLEGGDSYLVLSGLTLYNSTVKQPLLELSSVNYVVEGKRLKLKLSIHNRGEARPDKLVISLLKHGDLLYTSKETKAKMVPGDTFETEIELPADRGLSGDLCIRLIWMKLTRRWIYDKVINFT
ncbi:MAG: hypothetical protein QXW94_03720 [Desulfurococcaceae archaeon]